jgi:hypothetical protein
MNGPSVGRGMGDVVELKPVGETVEFGGRAADKRDVLLCMMLGAMRKLRASGSAVVDDAVCVATNAEIMRLQAERARAVQLVETMAGACDAAHDQRTKLEAEIPDGARALLFAANKEDRRVVAMRIERRGVRYLCNDFEIFEYSELGVESVFGRPAVA